MAALPSIQGRLSRALLLYSLLWTVTVSAAVSFVVRHEVDEMMDATLRESAQILHGLLGFDAPRLPLAAGGVLPAPPHKEELIWQIVDPGLGVVLRSHQAPPEALVPAGVRGFADVGEAWRVHSMPLGSQGRVLLVAQAALERAEARFEATGYSAAAAAVVGLLAALSLRRTARRELRPMAELSAAVQGFDPLQPQAQLPPAHRQELQAVRLAITELGARLAHRVAQERGIAAHAAHALRTPLAGLVAQLATAQRVAADAAQPMLAKARQAADRLSRVVTALLALFRTGAELHWQPVKLSELVEPLGGGLLALSVARPDRLLADPDLLSAALSNLLDNAVRHGAQSAVVALERDAAQVCVTITDDGPGLEADEREALQSALDHQSYEGRTGLGLMLADLVARAHGGRLRLMPCATGCAVALSICAPAALGEPAGHGSPAG